MLAPSRNWPAGTKMGPPPDFCWRMSLVRDERPDTGDPAVSRPAFVQAGPAPAFSATNYDQIKASYSRIAKKHAEQAGKLRFSRGVLYQSNFGVVHFELDNQDLVAIHDLYSHPPGRHELALVNVYRVPLNLFGEEPPQLHFDIVPESEQ